MQQFLIITLLFSSSVSMVILSDQMMQTTRKDMYYTVKLVENQIDYQKPLDNQVEKLNDLAYTKDTRLTIIDKNGNEITIVGQIDEETLQRIINGGEDETNESKKENSEEVSKSIDEITETPKEPSKIQKVLSVVKSKLDNNFWKN